MEIFHIARAADWEAARRSGSYTVSTLGRSLEEEGFLHAAHRDQTLGRPSRGVRRAAEPLLLERRKPIAQRTQRSSLSRGIVVGGGSVANVLQIGLDFGHPLVSPLWFFFQRPQHHFIQSHIHLRS